MLRFVSKQQTALPSATLVMFIICLCFVTGGTTSGSCAHIRLSNMSKKKQFVAAEEHSAFSLRFRLDTSNCPENNDQHFHIYVVSPASGGYICVVGITREGCSTSTNKDRCHCMEVNGYSGAVFTKILTMEDSGTWVWRTGGGERKEIEFIIRRSSKPDNVSVVPEAERTNTSSFDEHSDAKDDGNTIVLVSSCLGGVVTIVSIAVAIFVVIRKRRLRATRRQPHHVANGEDRHPLPGECNAYNKTRRVSSHFYDEVKYEM